MTQTQCRGLDRDGGQEVIFWRQIGVAHCESRLRGFQRWIWLAKRSSGLQLVESVGSGHYTLQDLHGVNVDPCETGQARPVGPLASLHISCQMESA